MFDARTKHDLIIEVWERLDCESVGAVEIEAIEKAVIERFGESAVDSPMTVARMLADEGAELRHSEIMQLYVARNSDRPYEAEFRNILDISNLRATRSSIRRMENLRRKFETDGDKTGLRLVLKTAREGRSTALADASDKRLENQTRQVKGEIAEWLTLWMQSPRMFEQWVQLRSLAQDFKNTFGEID